MMEPASSDSDNSSSNSEDAEETESVHPSNTKKAEEKQVVPKRQRRHRSSDESSGGNTSNGGRDSDSKHNSDDDDSSDDDASDHGQVRRQTKVRFQDDNDGSERDDESSQSGSCNDNSDDEQSVDEKLSLMERLQRQEAKQGSASIVGSLKDRRERRMKAVPIAKERIRAMRQERKEAVANDDNNKKRKSSDTKHTNEAPIKKNKPSKHGPSEVSSRRRQRLTLNGAGIGVEIGKNRYKPRDPRASSLSGHLNVQQFDHNYGFLQDMRQNEIKSLKQKLKALQQTGKKAQRQRRKFGVSGDSRESLEGELVSLQQQQALQQKQQLERDAKRAVKQKLQARVSERGSKAIYYPKRQELKQMQLEAKMDQIKKTKGKQGVQKFLEKRGKREKSKHAKKMRVSGSAFQREE